MRSAISWMRCGAITRDCERCLCRRCEPPDLTGPDRARVAGGRAVIGLPFGRRDRVGSVECCEPDPVRFAACRTDHHECSRPSPGPVVSMAWVAAPQQDDVAAIVVHAAPRGATHAPCGDPPTVTENRGHFQPRSGLTSGSAAPLARGCCTRVTPPYCRGHMANVPTSAQATSKCDSGARR